MDSLSARVSWEFTDPGDLWACSACHCLVVHHCVSVISMHSANNAMPLLSPDKCEE